MLPEEDWFYRKWRPGMAYLYMIICAFDFVLGPILFTVVQSDVSALVQWSPLTMKAGGLFHVAMGAILGVTAWSRGQEKMKNMEYFASNQATRAAQTEPEEPDEPEPPTINTQSKTAEPVAKESIIK